MMPAISQKIPKFFLIAFAIFFMAAWFSLVESFRLYRAEATLVVFSKSPAVSSSLVAGNISEIVNSVSFYDRLLADHRAISDPWTEESTSYRREMWSAVIDAETVPETSVVRLSISSRDDSQSEALLDASIETLYGFLSRLYDRDREVDIRLIDPVSIRPMIASPVALTLLSAILATVLAILLLPLFRVSIPSFPMSAIRKKILSKKMSDRIRPVGSFPDLPQPSETRVSSEEDARSLHSAVSKEDAQESHTEFHTTPSTDLRDEATEAIASRSESIVPPAPEASLEATPLSENTPLSQEEDAPVSFSEEPADIWERSRSLSRGNLRIQRTSAPPLETLSESPRRNQEEARTETPGRLEGIPARDFSWEKYLFQTSGETSEPTPEVPTVASDPTPASTNVKQEETSEPTPEELKARLNQLLRGEM